MSSSSYFTTDSSLTNANPTRKKKYHSVGGNQSDYGISVTVHSADTNATTAPYVCAACQRGKCFNCVSLRCQHKCHRAETQGLARVKRERKSELDSHRGTSGRF